jgi:hypothetical protein
VVITSVIAITAIIERFAVRKKARASGLFPRRVSKAKRATKKMYMVEGQLVGTARSTRLCPPYALTIWRHRGGLWHKQGSIVF